MTRRPALRRSTRGALLRWALSVFALAFVAWMVPLRDHCWDPAVPRSTRAAVTRGAGPDGAACTLHLRSGDVVIDGAACARLRCEPGLLSTLLHARLEVIGALLVLYGASTLVWAARWRALLGFAGIDLPLREVWRISIEAQAGGILLPGGIGGDALRIASVAGRPARAGATRAPLAIVVASVLLDRAVGLAVIAVVAVATALTAGAIGSHGPAGAASLAVSGAAGPAPVPGAAGAAALGGGALPAAGLVAVLAAIPVAFAVGVAALRASTWPRAGWPTKGRVGAFVMPVLAYVRHREAPRALVVAAGLSVLVAGSQFATIRGLVHALGASPVAGGERWVYLGTAMAFVVSALPALPGAWGTADATYVFFFAFAGLAPTVALTVCLLYRLFWYLSGVAGAILQFLHEGRPGDAPAPAAAGSPAGEGVREPPE